jgi:selenocysteine lyase/cysteine desulfurase
VRQREPSRIADAAADLHIPGPGPYLLTHSVGCLPRTARERAEEVFFSPWAERGSDAWPAWLEEIDRFRTALSTLLGGTPEDWCPQANVSSGLTKLLPALPKREGRRVWITSEDAFPSIGFVLGHAERLGLKLRLIPRDRDPSEEATWVDALTDDVCGVVLTHVHSTTGSVTPIRAVAKRCRELGVYSVIDVAQSAGILPLNVAELDADAVIGSCVKWLCGGPGAGFIWLRPDLSPQLAPMDVGWFSHAAPFEMDIHAFRYAAAARRFWGGTPSILSFAVATTGLEWVAKTGVGALREHNQRLARVFLADAPDVLRRTVNLDGCGGTLCLDVGQSLPKARAALGNLGARFDVRDTVIRLSFHACNSIDEARAIAQAWPR